MKFEKGFNPGQNNQYIEVNLGPNSQYFPNVTELTIINGDKLTGKYTVKPNNAGGFHMSNDNMDEHDSNKKLTTVKTAIFEYVSCIAPKLKPEWMQGWERFWTGLLDIDVIEERLCDVSKQQGTTFNRQFICRIIHYLSLKGFYKEPYRASDMTRALEGDDQHSIRTHGLNLYPDDTITKSIDKYISSLTLESPHNY